MTVKVAALYVRTDGPYAGREDVELFDEKRDARLYEGPWPVVAHPPCKRWGRYWSGGPSAKVRRKLGDDEGCFSAALASVKRFGGVLEHPEASHAWGTFGLPAPPRWGGWIQELGGGWTCCVEQGHYGHKARKATWLYYVGPKPPPLVWGPSKPAGVKLDEGFHSAAERRAKRLSQSPVGRLGKAARELTPPAFAEALIDLARLAGETRDTASPG